MINRIENKTIYLKESFSFPKGRGAIHAHCLLAVTGGPTLKATKAAFKESNYINAQTRQDQIFLSIQVQDVKDYLIRKDKEEKGITEEAEENPDEEMAPADNDDEDVVMTEQPKSRVDHRFDYETDSDEEVAMDTEEPKKEERDVLKEAYTSFSKAVIGNKMVENFSVENIGISTLHPIMDPMRWKPPFGQVYINNKYNFQNRNL